MARHFDFLRHLTGCQLCQAEGIQFAGVITRGEGICVTGKLDLSADHPTLELFGTLGSCHRYIHVYMTIAAAGFLPA